VENHRWILRSTNTGATAAIDPYGRVSVSTERHLRTALRAGFNFEHETTFYTRHGDLFAYFCAAVSVLGLGYSLICRDGLN
jgi:apolipoprotein N-acyltransferase